MAIDIAELENQLRKHMDDQPYSIDCFECGEKLEVEKKVDVDFDLLLDVHPCTTCMEKAANDRESDLKE